MSVSAAASELFPFVIYRCVMGSQAYGLASESSDIDRRGFYLPPADLEWSLSGVPEQLENKNEQVYWEIEKFIRLALKANPNVLECLYSPMVEYSTEVSNEIVAARHVFLSKEVYQTFNAYAWAQFKKLERDLRNQGEPRWKHVMHLIRLLLPGSLSCNTGLFHFMLGSIANDCSASGAARYLGLRWTAGG